MQDGLGDRESLPSMRNTLGLNGVAAHPKAKWYGNAAELPRATSAGKPDLSVDLVQPLRFEIDRKHFARLFEPDREATRTVKTLVQFNRLEGFPHFVDGSVLQL